MASLISLLYYLSLLWDLGHFGAISANFRFIDFSLYVFNHLQY